ncbi:hypothetical protein PTTG_00101 [Puccinia triticina 1-1 BBBD Race 1]|uniref:Rho-GAP domain-containing protein n=1 Tax=Puccinia triticina (isolate 1-1 / race 1 (BBBD)) TaxID=630390 RepID=A0A180GXL0_PUCT1|nr:hypothetical protein PTTG_00101 [Puccinia triticina 1-1 BBBD Race 1]
MKQPDTSFSTASSSESSQESSSSAATETESSSSTSSSAALQNQLIHKIIYSAGLDHQSNPLLVISASSFPAKLPAHLTLDSLTQQALSLFSPIISNGPYSLVIFASPAEHAPTVKQILFSYRQFSRPIRKNLTALWVVHPTFWAKTTVQVLLKTIVSWKMSRKIKWIKDLSTLASLVPIHQICIPPEVYKYDLTIEPAITVPPSFRKPPVFKVSLEELMGVEGQDGIPQVIQDCANCIRSSGMKFEGLFRRPPSLTTTQIIRDAYDRRQPVKMEDYADGPFLAASLIKLFLRELPQPIFPADFYSLFRACPPIYAQPIIPSHHDQSSLNTHNQAVLDYLREHILKDLRPKPAHILLDYVLKLCHDLALHSEHNKMDAHNLATCLAPTMIRSSDLISDAMMCKLPSPSSTKGSPDQADQSSPEPTSFICILKFMISCYPLLFDEPQEPISPACSSLSSSSMFKDSHSTMDLSLSSFRATSSATGRTGTSSVYEGSDDPSSLFQKLFGVRRPTASYLPPLRCTISHVGLSHAFSLADRRRSRLLQGPAGSSSHHPDQKLLRFATLQPPKTATNNSLPSLSSAFIPLSRPLSPSSSSDSSTFFSSTSVTTTTSTTTTVNDSCPSSTHPRPLGSAANHTYQPLQTIFDHQSRFAHSSDLNELD